MRIITTVADLRRLLAHEKSQGNRIGLVPTMGNLHAGHIKLVTTAREQCDFVVVTIFVNPLQFGLNEDLEAYPRTPDEDIRRLTESGCNALFTPSVAEMYPGGTAAHTLVSVPGLGDNYCGKSRPGHFNAVATVVSKLFNMVQPDSAYFGLKDFQQYQVIKRMVFDLQIPVRITGIETVREANGLAMSSRNNYLSAEQKEQAASLYRSLGFVADALNQGRTDFTELENQASSMLRDHGLTPDYIAICNALTLEPATVTDKSLVVLAAAFLGKTRLIDNIHVAFS